ncbi:LPS assembly lipoprotein LptE [Palleronia caenipelagi]|uniref:LPS-assembly lipoprotein n=1 Tax=Palleronia caenipelagi TaxID=2489174 RepID=A0A547Q0B9_9RHOB|nr:LPS assembly lipoprotein LptE [Palleronia caenipelagi]TRD19833.1 hypothetical protein FEV53_10335 [Palleronia caenipelagi]
MSWSRRSLIFAAGGLAACGFTPVYGPEGAADGISGLIAIAPPRDEPGYIFVRRMEERIGRAKGARYELNAEIEVEEEGLGITPGRDTTRIRLAGTIVYTLRDMATGQQVWQGRATNFTGYSTPVVDQSRVSIAGNPVTVRAAERDALDRLMTILADQVTGQLLATAPDWYRGPSG